MSRLSEWFLGRNIADKALLAEFLRRPGNAVGDVARAHACLAWLQQKNSNTLRKFERVSFEALLALPVETKSVGTNPKQQTVTVVVLSEQDAQVDANRRTFASKQRHEAIREASGTPSTGWVVYNTVTGDVFDAKGKLSEEVALRVVPQKKGIKLVRQVYTTIETNSVVIARSREEALTLLNASRSSRPGDGSLWTLADVVLEKAPHLVLSMAFPNNIDVRFLDDWMDAMDSKVSKNPKPFVALCLRDFNGPESVRHQLQDLLRTAFLAALCLDYEAAQKELHRAYTLTWAQTLGRPRGARVHRKRVEV